LGIKEFALRFKTWRAVNLHHSPPAFAEEDEGGSSILDKALPYSLKITGVLIAQQNHNQEEIR
jgi:hypothetical protein